MKKIKKIVLIILFAIISPNIGFSQSNLELKKTAEYNSQSSKTLIQSLVDLVSTGNDLSLNTDADSKMASPTENLENLKELDKWKKANSEAIYGVKGSTYDKPEWGRYTSKDGVIYAFVFDWPKDGILYINSDIRLKTATLLTDTKVKFKASMTSDGLKIKLPETAKDNYVTVIKLELLSEEDWANLKKYHQANKDLKPVVKKDNRVVFMGNSITERWVDFDPDFFKENNYVGRGISGQTTSQMLLRFKQDVINLNPKTVVIHAGTNDIAGNKGPITLEQIADNIFSMVDLAKAHKIKVVLASVLPANSYSWSPSIQPANLIIELNRMLAEYAKKNKIVFLDYYPALVDSNKGLKKEYGRDSVHPNLDGYKIMEPLVNEAIKKTLH